VNTFQPIFDKQKDYFNTDATKSYEWRIQQLDRMARMLNENNEVFQEAVSKDFKTALEEKVFEVAAPLATIEFTKMQLKEWMKPISAMVPKALAASGHTAQVIREPYGVTLIIGPFNGSLILLLDPAITALSAGNPCILKLAESIPATSTLLQKFVPKYFEPDSVTAVSGSREEVTELDATANLSDAAKKIVWGAMAWDGQWCTSPGYAYVHESVVGEFVAECRKAVIELYGTDPKNNSDYSRIISPKAVERLAGLIDRRKVVAGGASDPKARYIDPTILYPVTWDDPIMQDEIFGPLLPILTYQDIDAAILEVKKRPKPLSGFLFSRDQKAIDHFLASLSFGGGAINQVNVHLFVESMPFGGVGYSGIGHYYGKDGFDALTHAKSILVSPPDVAIEHLFPPYTAEKVQELNQWFGY
jgi:aldehyde dehydrogenase (NAD+)